MGEASIWLPTIMKMPSLSCIHAAKHHERKTDARGHLGPPPGALGHRLVPSATIQHGKVGSRARLDHPRRYALLFLSST